MILAYAVAALVAAWLLFALCDLVRTAPAKGALTDGRESWRNMRKGFVS